jgi:hypothetical protein
VRRSVYCTASFSVCSSRRTELPIIYADFRLDYKLKTLPFGGDRSAKTASVPVTLSPTTRLAKPIITTPVWPCQTAINLSNLTEGSDLRIFNPGSHGTETLFGNTFLDVDLSLVAPLKQGALTAQQYFRRCPGTQASHIESVQLPAARPLPTPSVLYAPFTG